MWMPCWRSSRVIRERPFGRFSTTFRCLRLTTKALSPRDTFAVGGGRRSPGSGCLVGVVQSKVGHGCPVGTRLSPSALCKPLCDVLRFQMGVPHQSPHILMTTDERDLGHAEPLLEEATDSLVPQVVEPEVHNACLSPQTLPCQSHGVAR